MGGIEEKSREIIGGNMEMWKWQMYEYGDVEPGELAFARLSNQFPHLHIFKIFTF
jgi:hypothetical protein